MIVWLNGTHGVGKTTASALVEQLTAGLASVRRRDGSGGPFLSYPRASMRTCPFRRLRSRSMCSRKRLEVLFDELAELTGQRNAIDGRIVDIVAEMDHDGLIGSTGCRSVAALVAWRTGVSPSNAATIATIAHRAEEFPRCVQQMREGRLSADQVGVIAERAGAGSDEHYAGVGCGVHGQSVADGGEAGTTPGSRSATGAQAVDQQDRRTRRPPPIGLPCRRWRRRSSTPR